MVEKKRKNFILKEMNEKLNSRRLREFKEIEEGNYHALL
jgi:hypothetical protein